MHKNINFNLFSVSVSAETRMEAEIRFRFGFGHKNLFRSVTSIKCVLPEKKRKRKKPSLKKKIVIEIRVLPCRNSA